MLNKTILKLSNVVLG